jgi:hypothetical protein
MTDPLEPGPIGHERRAAASLETTRARAFLAGFRAASAAIGRILLGVTLLIAGLALLGVEMRIALDVKTSPHWVHLALYIGIVIAAASILLPDWAKAFFGWLTALARGVRSGKE